MVIKTHTTGNEEANRVVSRKAHIFVVCGAGRQARAGPLPGLALIGFATLARAWPRFQLAQTREQMPNLVWHFFFHHVFRGNPQDGPEPLEEMKIKKSMHGCYLSMDTALHWQRLPVSHGQCVKPSCSRLRNGARLRERARARLSRLLNRSDMRPRARNDAANRPSRRR